MQEVVVVAQALEGVVVAVVELEEPSVPAFAAAAASPSTGAACA